MVSDYLHGPFLTPNKFVQLLLSDLVVNHYHLVVVSRSSFISFDPLIIVLGLPVYFTEVLNTITRVTQHDFFVRNYNLYFT